MKSQEVRSQTPLKQPVDKIDGAEAATVTELLDTLDAYQKIQGKFSEETADNNDLIHALREMEQAVRTREVDFDRALKSPTGLQALLPTLRFLASQVVPDTFERKHPEIPLRVLEPWAMALLSRQLEHYSDQLDAALQPAKDGSNSQKNTAMVNLMSVASALLFPSRIIAEQGQEIFLKVSVQALEKVYRAAKEPPQLSFPSAIIPSGLDDIRAQEYLYEYGSQDISDEIKVKVLESAEELEGVLSYITMDASKFMGASPSEGELRTLRGRRIQELLQSVMKKINLPREDVLSGWLRDDVVAGNINVAYELESLHPGGPRILAEQFGIYEFGRYPVEVLRNQIEEMESDKPYGLAVYPRSDEQASFQGSDFRLGVFMGKLHELGHTFRIIEVGNKIELARRIVALDNKYAPVAGKIGFAIIHGHGTPDSIQLGADNRLNTGKENIISKDVWNASAQRLSSFFRARVPIVLDSCSTGENAGIGQQLSAIFRTKVIAPDIPARLVRAIPKLTLGGNIDLDVQYEPKDVAKTYVRGVLKEERRKHK